MTRNPSKALYTFAAGLVLLAAHATSSDARTHAQRQSPPQAAYYTNAAPAYAYPYQTFSPGAPLTNDASTHNGG